MKSKLLFTLLVNFISLATLAQSNLQFYGSYIRNLNPGFRTNTYGTGVRYEFAKKPEFTKYLGLAFTLPMYKVTELEANAMNNWTEPSTYTVFARYTLPMYRLDFGGKIYLSGDAQNFEDVNVYLMGALEIIYMPNKPEYTYYDKEKYTLGYSEDSDVNVEGTSKYILNPSAYVGAGFEKSLGYGNIFLQGYLSYPVTRTHETHSSNMNAIDPIPVNVNIGYKIPLKHK